MLGVYIHIPFCVRKCAYCDFVSLEGLEKARAYADALIHEIHAAGKLYKQNVDTVFLGGGTPGALPEGMITELSTALRKSFAVKETAEITIETNPCVVTKIKLREYKEAGISRISLGLQAAQDPLLQILGRRHDVRQFDEAYALARTVGFDNINVDLIYAIPGQTMEDWEETLSHVLDLKPAHISAYALKIEQGTPMGSQLAAGDIVPFSEDEDALLYERAVQRLVENGYNHYEISNFALEGRECAHNLKYWNLKNYLGLGVAAHSNIERLRFANTEDVDGYIHQMRQGTLHYGRPDFINDEERKFEFIMLKLRLKDGFTFSEYKRLFHEDFQALYKAQLMKAQQEGLVEITDRRVCPTEKGFMLQNKLIGILTE